MGARLTKTASAQTLGAGKQPPKRLTDTAIARSASEAKQTAKRCELIDGGCEGLRIRVSPAGLRAFSLVCRDRLGAVRRFPVGTFPEMGIAEARDAARRLRLKVRDEGHDPTADRKRDRKLGSDARAGIGTLKSLLDIYGASQDAPRSWPASRGRVDKVFGSAMRKPAAKLRAVDLQLEADRYTSGQSAAFAVRTIRPALKWLAHREHVSPDLAVLRAPATVSRRERVLDHAELARLLPVLRAPKPAHGALLRFLLLTLARREEAAQAKWQHVDLKTKTWTIPKEHAKNREPHVVPLSRQAADLLESLKPVTPESDELVFKNANGNALGGFDRVCKAMMKKSGTTGWTRHDLRRTGATMLGEMGATSKAGTKGSRRGTAHKSKDPEQGVPPYIIEAALNHVAIHNRLATNYNRSRYRPEVARALQRLADALDFIEFGENPSKTG